MVVVLVRGKLMEGVWWECRLWRRWFLRGNKAENREGTATETVRRRVWLGKRASWGSVA
jgi:hypothetical protein